MHQDASLSNRPFHPTWQRALKGLRPVVFDPCTLVRTWGTRPVPNGLPLQFESGQSVESLGLTGEEVFDLEGIRQMLEQKFAQFPSPRATQEQVTGNPVFREQ